MSLYWRPFIFQRHTNQSFTKIRIVGLETLYVGQALVHLVRLLVVIMSNRLNKFRMNDIQNYWQYKCDEHLGLLVGGYISVVVELEIKSRGITRQVFTLTSLGQIILDQKTCQSL
jgi:hypothetical protein